MIPAVSVMSSALENSIPAPIVVIMASLVAVKVIGISIYWSVYWSVKSSNCFKTVPFTETCCLGYNPRHVKDLLLHRMSSCLLLFDN